MKVKLNYWTKGNAEKVYANDAETGAPILSFSRSRSHEQVHGLGLAQSHAVVIDGDEATGRAILAAVGVSEHTDIEGNSHGFHWPDVAQFGAGCQRIPGAGNRTPKKELTRLAKIRDARIFEV